MSTATDSNSTGPSRRSSALTTPEDGEDFFDDVVIRADGNPARHDGDGRGVFATPRPGDYEFVDPDAEDAHGSLAPKLKPLARVVARAKRMAGTLGMRKTLRKVRCAFSWVACC